MKVAGQQQDDPLHDRVVPLEDRVEEQPAHARAA